ncbi:CT847 family type III secretion system effector [Chlamydia sp. 17-3921]|uniref:CT847 family type III secretion system effector n=1 Tax=Chlamydia sp. 17-3921 TaxID=2675798 RepID=UPI00191B0334|nr:CT847 family type III secretion system effector [Chlamydia sp. 17-3921]
MTVMPLNTHSEITTIIPNSTKIISDSITINKKSAMHFCIAVMLQLATSTTEFSKSIMAVLQDNTSIQQQKTKELISIPLLKVPDLKPKSGSKKDEYTNQNEIQAYQSSNQQITANRQLIQQELSAAQQRAQANQKAVNATSTEAMQILQATQSLLSSLAEYTDKANLRGGSAD